MTGSLLAGGPVKIPSYPSAEGKIDLNNDNLGTIIHKFLPHIFVISGLLMLVMIVYGGFQLMISGGDNEGIREGKAKITWGIVGFLIVFSSYFIVQIVQAIFRITIF